MIWVETQKDKNFDAACVGYNLKYMLTPYCSENLIPYNAKLQLLILLYKLTPAGD